MYIVHSLLALINISLTNQNAASLSNVHPCNNVRVPGGIARGENGIRYPNVTDHQNIQFRMILFCISNKNAFYSRVVIKDEQF